MAWIEIHINEGDLRTINLNHYKYIEPYESGAKTIFYQEDHSTNIISDINFDIIAGQLDAMIINNRTKKFDPLFFLHDRDENLDKYFNFDFIKAIYNDSEDTRMALINFDDSEHHVNGAYSEYSKLIREFTAGLDANGNSFRVLA